MDRENAMDTANNNPKMSKEEEIARLWQQIDVLEGDNRGQRIIWHYRRDGHIRVIVTDDTSDNLDTVFPE